MRRCALLALLLGCRNVLGIDDPTLAPDAPLVDAAPLPPCPAQRVVHIVAGSGALAWFTLLWPAPEVIRNFQETYAYDDTSLARSLGTTAHPLYVREFQGTPLWSARGRSPLPTAMLAGRNETHSLSPQTIVRSVQPGIDEVAVRAQNALAPALPVLAFGSVGPYAASIDHPLVRVDAVDEAIASFPAGTDTSALAPTNQQLAAYVLADASQPEQLLAEHLAFTANALRRGLLGTVIVPGLLDDDAAHAAFISNTATSRANSLARALDAFYADLALSDETCGDASGARLTVGDNTVLYVTGDTPKDAFARGSGMSGWGDGTTGNSNVVYVRSNGFLEPGWFGDITDTTLTNWDPSTGALVATGSIDASTRAAWGAIVYAIARGDRSVVTMHTSAPFDGPLASD